MPVDQITKPYRLASGEGLADVRWMTGRKSVKTVTGEAPPTAAVMPPEKTTARVFGSYGVEILGPPPTLEEL